jgi:trehalose 6-phosphate phosphatase
LHRRVSGIFGLQARFRLPFTVGGYGRTRISRSHPSGREAKDPERDVNAQTTTFSPSTGTPPPAISRQAALFLDVDGCLLEFSDDPSSVRAGPRLLAGLDQVSVRLDGAVALVSGRTLARLDEIFHPAAYAAAGLHGLELRGDQASSTFQVPHLQLERIMQAAQEVLAEFPGAFVEDKGLAIALHWRAAPSAARTALAFAVRMLPLLPGYKLEPGNHVVELRPAGADKGTAIQRFMACAPFAGRTPIFAGDDLTDEAGFAAVNAMGGISILVGDRPQSRAIHRLADPASVLAWLEAVP